MEPTYDQIVEALGKLTPYICGKIKARIAAVPVRWPSGNHRLCSLSVCGLAPGLSVFSRFLDQSSSTTDGTQLQLFDCNGTAAQQWTLPQ